MTATDQTRVSRPERTSPPNMVPGSTKTYAKDPEFKKKMSAAVKIGIAIGVIAVVGILVTLATFALIHWRKKTKYNTIGHGQAVDAKLLGTYTGHTAPTSSALGPFEPMRNEFHHDPRQSKMASPPPQHQVHSQMVRPTQTTRLTLNSRSGCSIFHLPANTDQWLCGCC